MKKACKEVVKDNPPFRVSQSSYTGLFSRVGYLTLSSTFDSKSISVSNTLANVETSKLLYDFIYDSKGEYVSQGQLLFSKDSIHGITKDKLCNMLNTFFENAENDACIIYFSGYANDNGELLFESPGNDFYLSYEDLFSFWRERNNKIKNTHLLIIFDCVSTGTWVNKLIINGDFRDASIQSSCHYKKTINDISDYCPYFFTQVLLAYNKFNKYPVDTKYLSQIMKEISPQGCGFHDVAYYSYDFDILYNSWEEFDTIGPIDSKCLTKVYRASENAETSVQCSRIDRSKYPEIKTFDYVIMRIQGGLFTIQAEILLASEKLHLYIISKDSRYSDKKEGYASILTGTKKKIGKYFNTKNPESELVFYIDAKSVELFDRCVESIIGLNTIEKDDVNFHEDIFDLYKSFTNLENESKTNNIDSDYLDYLNLEKGVISNLKLSFKSTYNETESLSDYLIGLKDSDAIYNILNLEDKSMTHSITTLDLTLGDYGKLSSKSTISIKLLSKLKKLTIRDLVLTNDNFEEFIDLINCMSTIKSLFLINFTIIFDSLTEVEHLNKKYEKLYKSIKMGNFKEVCISPLTSSFDEASFMINNKFKKLGLKLLSSQGDYSNVDLLNKLFSEGAVEDLDLSYCYLKEINLLDIPSLSVKRLALTNWKIENRDDFETFSKSILPFFMNLEHLDISSNSLTDVKITGLLTQLESFSQLKSLNISNNYISKTGFDQLAKSIKFYQKLAVLDISNMNISESNLLAVSLKQHRTLKELNISNCGIGNAPIFFEIFNSNASVNRIKKVNLNYNAFSKEKFTILTKSVVWNNSINVLSMNYCINEEIEPTKENEIALDRFTGISGMKVLNEFYFIGNKGYFTVDCAKFKKAFNTLNFRDSNIIFNNLPKLKLDSFDKMNYNTIFSATILGGLSELWVKSQDLKKLVNENGRLIDQEALKFKNSFKSLNQMNILEIDEDDNTCQLINKYLGYSSVKRPGMKEMRMRTIEHLVFKQGDIKSLTLLKDKLINEVTLISPEPETVKMLCRLPNITKLNINKADVTPEINEILQNKSQSNASPADNKEDNDYDSYVSDCDYMDYDDYLLESTDYDFTKLSEIAIKRVLECNAEKIAKIDDLKKKYYNNYGKIARVQGDNDDDDDSEEYEEEEYDEDDEDYMILKEKMDKDLEIISKLVDEASALYWQQTKVIGIELINKEKEEKKEFFSLQLEKYNVEKKDHELRRTNYYSDIKRKNFDMEAKNLEFLQKLNERTIVTSKIALYEIPQELSPEANFSFNNCLSSDSKLLPSEAFTIIETYKSGENLFSYNTGPTSTDSIGYILFKNVISIENAINSTLSDVESSTICLEIDDSNIYDGIPHILKWIRANKITVLSLIIKNISIGASEIEALDKLLMNKKLKELHLVNTFIDDQESKLLFSKISTLLTCINLSGNMISDSFLKDMMNYIKKNRVLKSLILSNVGLINMQTLFSFIKENDKIEYLDISENNSALYELNADISSLKILKSWTKEVTKSSIEEIKEQTSTIKELNISDMDLQQNRAFLVSLEDLIDGNLEKLNIEKCQPDSILLRSMNQSFNYLNSLQILSISNTPLISEEASLLNKIIFTLPSLKILGFKGCYLNDSNFYNIFNHKLVKEEEVEEYEEEEKNKAVSTLPLQTIDISFNYLSQISLRLIRNNLVEKKLWPNLTQIFFTSGLKRYNPKIQGFENYLQAKEIFQMIKTENEKIFKIKTTK